VRICAWLLLARTWLVRPGTPSEEQSRLVEEQDLGQQEARQTQRGSDARAGVSRSRRLAMSARPFCIVETRARPIAIANLTH